MYAQSLLLRHRIDRVADATLRRGGVLPAVRLGIAPFDLPEHLGEDEVVHEAGGEEQSAPALPETGLHLRIATLRILGRYCKTGFSHRLIHDFGEVRLCGADVDAHDLAEYLLRLSARRQLDSPPPRLLRLARAALLLGPSHELREPPLLLEGPQLLGHGVQRHAEHRANDGAANPGDGIRPRLGKHRGRVFSTALLRAELLDEVESALLALVHHVLHRAAAKQPLEQDGRRLNLLLALRLRSLRGGWALHGLGVAVVGQHGLALFALRRLGLLGQPQRRIRRVESVAQLLGRARLQADSLVALLGLGDGHLERRARQRLLQLHKAFEGLELHRSGAVLVGQLVGGQRAALPGQRRVYRRAVVGILGHHVTLVHRVELCDLASLGELAERLDTPALDERDLGVLLGQLPLPLQLHALLPRLLERLRAGPELLIKRLQALLLLRQHLDLAQLPFTHLLLREHLPA
mmetsp:Transcript_34463/g.111228  ORF Transcript_34463/g.111228 Transcript_34463/m.111228 type:complete len:464 (+) Transcript_34463:248-1639(+)|eukprot:scaffold11172_cov122-Isochrysis_galbana.AAC.2